MQKYFFKPRVGQNYWKGIGGLRVLIAGSHFRCPYSNCVHLKKECASSSTIFEMDQKCPCYLDKEDQEYYRLSNSDTIEVNSYLEGFSYQAFSAFTYLTQCQQLGFQVPDDISIIGFDDLPIAACTSPPLTTIRQDRLELGKSGFFALSSLLNHIPISTYLLHAQLIQRESTRKIPL